MEERGNASLPVLSGGVLLQSSLRKWPRRPAVRTRRARGGRDPAVAVSEAEEGGGRGTLALVGDLATSAAASVASLTREALMGRPGGYRAGAAPAPASALRVACAVPKDAASAGRSLARHAHASRCATAKPGTLVACEQGAGNSRAGSGMARCLPRPTSSSLTSAFRCSHQRGDACERPHQSCPSSPTSRR
jgi:hypothetical protein